MERTRLGILLGPLLLVVAACGGSAADTTTTTSTTVAAAPPTTQSVTTSTLPATTTTAAKLGATSTMIVVQQDLTALGLFDGKIDGIAGEKTRAAIAKFQADAGITADGNFGPNTDAALVPLLVANEDYVAEVQETLIELEFYGGPVDGSIGRGTKKGIELLQKSCELEETGTLDIKTRLCLGGHL
jgi:peptidoglycan hydrolase-like protein with peptidoglycan-binding domain